VVILIQQRKGKGDMEDSEGKFYRRGREKVRKEKGR
jgi:hypothetical protein